MTITTILTDRGRQILVARVPGDPPIASIRIAVGDGNGAFPTPNPAQVALVRERWRGAAAAALDGPRITFSVNIPASVGGWNIREIGVFIGPVGAEELAIVSQFDGRYKPAAGENGASSLTPVVALDYSGSVVGAFTITLDPNLNPLDPSVHRTVNARVTGAPPVSPAEGSAWAIAAGATGDFAGKGGQIARRRGTAWVYEVPLDGHVVREQGTSGAWWQKNGSTYEAYVFPFVAHNHDDRYNTKTEITALLGAYVQRAGDTMSGRLRLSYNFPDVVLGEAGGAWRAIKAGNVGSPGNLVMQYSTDLFAASAVDALTLLPSGNVQSNGSIQAATNLISGGGINVSNWVGTADRVLTGGATAQYRTLSELGVRHSVHAFARVQVAPGGNTLSSVATLLSRSCSISYAFFPGGATNLMRVTVTFSTPTPDTNYEIQGTSFPQSKTVNGFVFDVLAPGSISDTAQYAFAVIV